MSTLVNVMQVFCQDEAAMLALGAALGRVLAASRAPSAVSPTDPPWSVLLSGELGAGKTTLTRGLVLALPGGEASQVASPSFTLMNCYPTRPPIAHVDCYRLEPEAAAAAIPDLLEEAGPEAMAVIEWMDRLPRAAWPTPALHIRWLDAAQGRRMELTALGAAFPTGLASALAPWRTDA